MKAIIGLGNPGREYAGTRHNVGFDAVTALADKYDLRIKDRKFKALVSDGIIEGQRIILVHPQTYMNLSGESVKAVADYYRLEPEDLIIVCDDINLDIGRLRIRKKGSAGGHNGLKSIISELGTDAFPRIRIGVGGKPEGWDLAKHVLGRFSEDDDKIIRDMLKEAAGALETWLKDGIDMAMNRYNSIGKASEQEQNV